MQQVTLKIHVFVFRGKARAGDKVLVHGASGAVGLAACQMAKAHGNNNFFPKNNNGTNVFHCWGETL